MSEIIKLGLNDPKPESKKLIDYLTSSGGGPGKNGGESTIEFKSGWLIVDGKKVNSMPVDEFILGNEMDAIMPTGRKIQLKDLSVDDVQIVTKEMGAER